MSILEVMESKDEGTCYKITQSDKLSADSESYYYENIIFEVRFNESISQHWDNNSNPNWRNFMMDNYKNIPSINVYITSQSNAYGAIYGKWVDADTTGLKLYVSDNQKRIQIKSTQYKYLDCEKDSFYQWAYKKVNISEIKNQYKVQWDRNELDTEHCPKNACLPSPKSLEKHVLGNYIPRCQTKWEYQCLYPSMSMAFFAFFWDGVSRKTCDTLEYSGEIRLHEEPVEDVKKIRFQYNLDRTMKVQEEYLIYDEVGLIGSVGGTFGMFIGFSFANIVSLILNQIQRFISI